MAQKMFLNTAKDLRFGLYDDPVGWINFEDYPLRSAFREILPKEERQRRFVHFHFMGLTCPQFIAGCSLAKTSAQTSVFFYLFNRQTGEMLKKGCRVGEKDQAQINLDPDKGLSRITGRNMSVEFEADGDTLQKSLKVDLGGETILNMQFCDAPDRFDTLRLCTPTGADGWTYCQKVAGTPATRTLNVNHQSYDLENLGATAHHDFTAGFLRRETFWNWACLTGHDEEGRLIGCNLSNGVNESGFSENVFWVDGKAYPAGLISFSYDPDDLSQTWRITSDTGTIDLEFISEGAYTAFHKEGPTPTDFAQLFGHFQGTIMLPNGKQLTINAIPGFCERQYAVWWPDPA